MGGSAPPATRHVLSVAVATVNGCGVSRHYTDAKQALRCLDAVQATLAAGPLATGPNGCGGCMRYSH
jgi:hypothetical protein